MAEQLTHDTPSHVSVIAHACRRCGIRYSRSTAYIPCFEEGDTLKTWQARHQETLDACPPGTINDILRSKKDPLCPTGECVGACEPEAHGA